MFVLSRFSGEARFLKAKFLRGANFNSAIFSARADFFQAQFSSFADFSSVKFLNEVHFSEAVEESEEANSPGSLKRVFNGETLFTYAIFEQPNKTMFDVSDLSQVSFAGSDISKVTFTDRVKWGGTDGLKVIEEEWIEKQSKQISLDLVLYVYRRLRENYEFKLKFDEAGKFFIKEMELKRSYRTVPLRDKSGSLKVIKNNRLRRHFSLTGLYYHFSTYGESIVKPVIIGAITVGLSTLFWSMQASPTLQPTFSTNAHTPYSNFTGLYNITDHTHLLKAFERSLGDFLPLLPSASDIKIGAIDYIIKIVGGALTFGLLIIALRRKFERKYTR